MTGGFSKPSLFPSWHTWARCYENSWAPSLGHSEKFKLDRPCPSKGTLTLATRSEEVKGTQSCPTLCDPMDYTVHGILQARILEWVAFPFSRGSSWPRNWTEVSCIAGRILYQLSYQGSPCHIPNHNTPWAIPFLGGGASGKEPSCPCRRHNRLRFDPWFGKIPWIRKWQPTPVFLPGKSHGQRSLADYSPYGLTELDTTEVM